MIHDTIRASVSSEENHMLMPAGVIKSSDNHVTFNHWVTGSNPVPLTILRVSELLGDVTCEDMGCYHASHLPMVHVFFASTASL